MDSETHNNSLQQTLLTLQFTLIIAVVSTVIIYMIDRFMLNHSNFGPLTEFQFYGILFIVVFGLVAGLLFYQEEKDETRSVNTSDHSEISRLGRQFSPRPMVSRTYSVEPSGCFATLASWSRASCKSMGTNL